MYRVLAEQPNRTVIFAADKSPTYIIPPADRGPIRVLPEEGSLSYLDLVPASDLGKDPLLIADSILPPALPFSTLVISSPDRLAYRSLNNVLNRYCVRRLYMPLPTEEEVLRLRALAFPHLDEAGVRARMALWGPIPRHVLELSQPLDQLHIWERAKAVKLEVLAAVSRGHANTSTPNSGDELDAPHRLVHERTAGQDAPPQSLAADVREESFYFRGAAILPPFLR